MISSVRNVIILVAISTPALPGQAEHQGQAEHPRPPADKLRRAIEQDAALTPQTRQALREFLDRLQTTRQTHPRPSVLDRVAEQVAVHGDFRLRQESEFAKDAGRADRSRQRMRLRLGATFEVSPTVTIGARLRTGDPDAPTSPHVTLGDVFDGLVLSFDQAYLTYRPAGVTQASVTLGKFSYPFRRNPVFGELLWDDDVQPEGIATNYTLPMDGLLSETSLAAGVFPILERASGSDSFVSALELSTAFTLGDKSAGRLSVAYYHYSDTSPDGSTAILRDNSGNATTDTTGDGKADRYTSRFGILHSVASISLGELPQPLVFAAEFIRNTRAAISKDTGWAIGMSYGSTKAAGDARLYYQWQVVEQDAVFTPFAQDDFLMVSNHRSHVFGVNYQVLPDAGLHLWGLVSARDQPTPGQNDQDQWRLRLDFDVKF